MTQFYDEVNGSLFSSEMSFRSLTFFRFGLGGLTSGLSTVGLTFNFRFAVHVVLPGLFVGVCTGSTGVLSIRSSPTSGCDSARPLADDGRDTSLNLDTNWVALPM